MIKLFLFLLSILSFLNPLHAADTYSEPTTFTLRVEDPLKFLLANNRLEQNGNISRIQADLDDDGQIDWLLMADGFWSDRMGSHWAIFLRDGDHFLTPIASLHEGSITFHGRNFFIGDFDQDGTTELVAGYHVSGSVTNLVGFKVSRAGIRQWTIEAEWKRDTHTEWTQLFEASRKIHTIEKIPIQSLLHKYPTRLFTNKQDVESGKAHSRIETTPTEDGYTSVTLPRADQNPLPRPTPRPRKTDDPLAYTLLRGKYAEGSTVITWNLDINSDGLVDMLIAETRPEEPDVMLESSVYLRQPDNSFIYGLPSQPYESLALRFAPTYLGFGTWPGEVGQLLVGARQLKQGRWVLYRYQLGPEGPKYGGQGGSLELHPDTHPEDAARLDSLKTSTTLIRNSPAWHEYTLRDLAPKYRFNTYSDYMAHITAGMDDPKALAYIPDGQGGFTTQTLTSMRRDPRKSNKYLSRYVEDPQTDFVIWHKLAADDYMQQLKLDINQDGQTDYLISRKPGQNSSPFTEWNLYVRLEGTSGYIAEEQEVEPLLSIQFSHDKFYYGPVAGLGAGDHLLAHAPASTDSGEWVDYRLMGIKLLRLTHSPDESTSEHLNFEKLVSSYPATAELEVVPVEPAGSVTP